jgi:phosphatidylserine/phosphatidylglycerophosphate/cardiolipin synthase-like enzyme
MIPPGAHVFVQNRGVRYLLVSALCLALALPDCPIIAAGIEVLYAPDDAPLDRVVTLYQQAKRYIYVAVYGLTYPRAVEALVAAKKRGVDVRMLPTRSVHRTSSNTVRYRRCDWLAFPSVSISTRA